MDRRYVERLSAYFSINGGRTDLADFGRTSDYSDFLNSGVQRANNPFNEFYTGSTLPPLTSIDITEMDVIGFDTVSPPAGSISINDLSIVEGNSGTKALTFTVTRTGGTAAFSDNYATAAGTASGADGDYVATSGTLAFGNGINTQTIAIMVSGDTKPEANETFSVNLSGATNGATISKGTGTGTILNDDEDPLVNTILLQPVSRCGRYRSGRNGALLPIRLA
jgi:hypothetical protein